MENINCVIAFIIGVLFTLTVFFIGTLLENKKSKNKIHFYVARDMDNTLWLYISKPYRKNDYFYPSSSEYIITSQNYFCKFGLDKKDYNNLKWEDEPVEVFLNLED